MSGRGLVGSNLYGDIDRKITFLCPLRYVFEASEHFKSVMFLRLVSILKLEGLLQGYVKCKNTMRGNVNFLTQNVKSETSLLD